MYIIDVDVSLPLNKMHIDYLGLVDREIIIDNLSKVGIRSFCARIIPPNTHRVSGEDIICKSNSVIFESSMNTSIEQFPVLYVNPENVDCSCKQIMFYAERGTHLIGNFSTMWLQQKENVDKILKTAEEMNMTIMLCNESVSDVVEIVSNYPNISVIAGGYGSKGFTPSIVIELMRKYNNLYLNISGTVWTYNYILSDLCTKLPVERILFGSGYPFTNPAATVEAVKWELRKQNSQIVNMILGLNIKRLIEGKR